MRINVRDNATAGNVIGLVNGDLHVHEASPVTSPGPAIAAVLVARPGPESSSEAPLETRWRAGQEGWLGDRCYLLRDDAGLIQEGRDPSGEHIRRQALARQTAPAPADGHAYVWLRQAGHSLTRERDLLACAVAAPDAARTQGRPGGRPVGDLPAIAHYHAAGDAVTLALSWPADRDGRLPCETLRTRFPPGTLGPWQVSLLLAGLRGVLISLEQLHRLGVSHRNLVPEAIIVTGNGQFVLRDLGLAATGFRPGEGPASYQAPEQAYGARGPVPGPATDVYQLAAVTYHLITGRVPGRGTPPPPARHPALSARVTGVISAALAASPANRPRTGEFRAALRGRPRPREAAPMT